MRKNWAALALTGMLCLTTFAGTQTVSAETADSAKQVDIVFTHDTHSHLNTFTTIVDEAEKEVGGFARINTLIQEQKAKNPDTLVIDGGDFSMGTLIQTVFETQAAEIRMLGYMGCDVTTLGNHEFAENDVDFSTQKDLENIHEEHNLGDIMSDAYAYAVENAADFDGVPVDVAVVPSGTVRDTYAKGDITVEQVFNSFSLGIGADGVPGYPLISVYLTGKELKTAAEIDASVSDFMTTARLYSSGLNFTYNPNRMILNKVTDVYLDDGNGGRIELEDDKLYRVVADLYSGQMLSAVTDMSYGLLSLVPKYADGTPIEDFEDVIITENGKELKAWDAIARYMESFEDTDGDGIANVPEYYSTDHDRKVVDDSRNIVDLVKNPNKFTGIIVGVIAVLILLVIFIILLLSLIHISEPTRRS